MRQIGQGRGGTAKRQQMRHERKGTGQDGDRDVWGEGREGGEGRDRDEEGRSEGSKGTLVSPETG